MFPFDLLPLKTSFQLDELMMLFVAIVLDLGSILLLLFALDDFGILDACGWIIIGVWVFNKTGSMPSRKGKNMGSKITGRFIGVGIFEIIPYLGALPTWTLFVYSVAKDGADEVDAIKRERGVW